MRISDWSSDVCSSDLWLRRDEEQGGLGPAAAHHRGDPRGRQEACRDRRGQLLGQQLPGPAARLGRQYGAEFPQILEPKRRREHRRHGQAARQLWSPDLARRVDRKSGVWGKSVTVRGDYGGRRVIKTKTTS